MRPIVLRRARLAQDQAHQIQDTEGVAQLAAPLCRQTSYVDRVGERYPLFRIDELLLEHGPEQAPVCGDDVVDVLRREAAVGANRAKPGQRRSLADAVSDGERAHAR